MKIKFRVDNEKNKSYIHYFELDSDMNKAFNVAIFHNILNIKYTYMYWYSYEGININLVKKAKKLRQF